ncbi:alpha-ketoglutarate-dependent dioxygenase alkB homolog 6 [Halyomorpha halys]|uniref:alpha-ketoglutarate-dependent dioxygenase alkB homolog 6 n=1 Tax=Halyomorpha halys TaxID=286706 RepID=UPI0006D4DAE9|nr:alpha-ketoglutarate-dependent dioxygenase alkB homolog 6 [Halyomorpha halys]
MDLEKYQIRSAPPTIYYIPDFINEPEENWILDKVYTAPKPKWTQLLNRRLQNWGGLPIPNGMIVEPIPSWLKTFMDKVSDLKVFNDGILRANHVLINEYLPGQGIMPHVDGPLFYPTIATISCSSHTVLEFEKNFAPDEEKADDSKISVFLQRRSLVIVKDTMYTDYKHTIRELKEDEIDENILNSQLSQLTLGDKLQRETRISLTIRHVPKISKIKLKFGK